MRVFEKMFLLFSVLLYFTSATATTNVSSDVTAENKFSFEPRIIGGQIATPHFFPYQVYIKGSSGGWCGGVLISQNYVLTTASCVYSENWIEVTLGAYDINLNEPSQIRINCTEIQVHYGYNPGSFSNDISAIRLSKSVSYTAAIRPVFLPSRADATNSFAGALASFSGWGRTTENGEYPNFLLFTQMFIISNDECRQSISIVFEDNICTAGSTVAPCNGDGGGPLVTDNKLVGLCSFHSGYSCAGYPSGFTRITSFLEWIEQNTDVIIQ